MCSCATGLQLLFQSVKNIDIWSTKQMFFSKSHAIAGSLKWVHRLFGHLLRFAYKAGLLGMSCVTWSHLSNFDDCNDSLSKKGRVTSQRRNALWLNGRGVMVWQRWCLVVIHAVKTSTQMCTQCWCGGQCIMSMCVKLSVIIFVESWKKQNFSHTLQDTFSLFTVKHLFFPNISKLI